MAGVLSCKCTEKKFLSVGRARYRELAVCVRFAPHRADELVLGKDRCHISHDAIRHLALHVECGVEDLTLFVGAFSYGVAEFDLNICLVSCVGEAVTRTGDIVWRYLP